MSSRTHALLVAVLVATGLAGCGKSPEEHLASGKALLQASKPKDAVLELKTALQKQPNNAETRLLLAQAHLLMGALAEAEKEYRKALELGASNADVLPGLASVLVKMREFKKVLELSAPAGLDGAGLATLHTMRAAANFALRQPAEAEAELKLANQADAGLPALLLLRAQKAVSEKDVDGAMALVDQALAKDARFVDGYYFKARLLEATQQVEAALAVYAKVAGIDGNAYQAYLAMANLHYAQKRKDEAEKALKSAEKGWPNVPLVKFSRGVFELRNNNLKAANDAILQVLKVAPDYLPAQLASAMINLGLGNPEQSIKAAQLVLAQQPNNAVAARVLAASQLRAGEAKNALATLAPLLESRPHDPGLLSLAGEAYMMEKNFQQALDALKRAGAAAPGDATIKGRQAMSLLAMGQTEEALAELQQASALGREDVKADVALIDIHLRRGDFDKALQVIDTLEGKRPKNPAVFTMRAITLAGKNDMTGARTALEKALALDPKYFPAVASLARLDIAEKKPAAAKARYEAVLKRDANHFGAMMGLAELALREGRETEYEDWLNKVIKAHPKAVQPRAMLSRYHLTKRHPEKAIESAALAVKDNPEDVSALNLLGAAQMAGNRSQQAVETYRALAAKQPKSPQALVLLAGAQAASGQVESSRGTYKSALALDPAHLQAMVGLYRLDMRDKRLDSAMQWALKLQSVAPRSPDGFELEGNVHAASKQWARALQSYEKAVSLAPSPNRFGNVFKVLLNAGKSGEATQRLSQWLKQNPKDNLTRMFAAQVYAGRNEPSAAIQLYEQVLASEPKQLVALNNLAMLYHDRKDPKAVHMAERAFELATGNAAVMDTLGWVLAGHNDLKRALPLLRSAAEKLPKDASVRYHYAVALAKSGKPVEAKAELNAALSSKETFPEQEAAKTLLRSL